jgi:hypothetical protein
LPSEWRTDLSAEVYEFERVALALHPPLLKNIKIYKETSINVRCTSEQKERLEAVAASEGLGVSSWLLHNALRVAYSRSGRSEP